MEEWKVIEGTSGKYKVSNYGSCTGSTGKLLKLIEMEIGYLSIAVSLGSGKVVKYYVHKLVADNFIGLVPHGYIVNHKDHNKHNNNVTNLEVISRAENASHWAKVSRSSEAGRKRSGFCLRGHELKGDRVYCLECRHLKNSGFIHEPPNDKEWKASIAPGYLVSKDGFVWSIKTSRLLKPSINKPGYEYLNLRVDGKTKNFSVHRLVAEAFIGKIPEGMVIDHINSNKLDNSSVNLRIVSRQINSLSSREKIRVEGRQGFSINEQQAGEIKWLTLNTVMSQREIGEIYGITQSPVSSIKNGKQWGYVKPVQPKSIINSK